MNEIAFRFFYNLATTYPWLGSLAVFASEYLGWILVALVVIKFSKKLLFILTTAGSAWLISHLIKWGWPVARPFVELSEIVPLITPGDTGAFPSGHATFFFTLALAVYALDRRSGQWLILGATIIGLGRVMVGVHWPSDIFGGLILSLVVFFLSLFITRLRDPGFARRSALEA